MQLFKHQLEPKEPLFGTISITKAVWNVNMICLFIFLVALAGDITSGQSAPRQPRPQVSQWSLWSLCSSSCSPGKAIRSRRCLNQDTTMCTAARFVMVETKSCNTELCQFWGGWSETPCSASCGNGFSSVTRYCSGTGTNGPPQCHKVLVQCNIRRCSVTRPPLPSWNPWAPWSACFPKCDRGKRGRSRKCTINGVLVDESRCPRQSNVRPGATESQSCNFDMCEVWSTWRPFRECSKTCGATREKRRLTRMCLGKAPTANPTKAYHDCNSRDLPCNSAPCPSRPPLPARKPMTEVKVGSWANWRQWSLCSTTCGQGIKIRTRLCHHNTQRQSHAACGARRDAVDRSSCSIRVCTSDTTTSQPPTTISTTTSTAISPGKASWADWLAWSDCSATCDAGLIIRVRACKYRNGRKALRRTCGRKQPTQTKLCSSHRCIDNASTTATKLPPFTTAPSTTASTESTIGKASWRSWMDWSSCTASCSPGIKVRRRTCKYSDGTNANGKCIGSSENKDTCNKQLCREWEVWKAAGCSVTCANNDDIPGIQVTRRQCKTVQQKTAAESCYVVTNLCNSIKPCSDRPPTPTGTTIKTTTKKEKSTPAVSPRTSKSIIEKQVEPDSTSTPSKPRSIGSQGLKECDTEICRVWSRWRTQPCNQTCGEGGTQIRRRTCSSGRIAFGTPETCYSRSQPCGNNLSCQGGAPDPKLDVLFLVDSSRFVDDCDEIEESTGFSPPFMGDQLTKTISPTYVRMKKFMNDFVKSWRGVSDNGTRISIQLFSDLCSPHAKSNLHVEKRFNESHRLVAQYINDLPYLCGEFWFDWALRCAIDSVMTTSFGDREDVQNVVVALLSNAPSTSQPSDFVLERILKRIVGKGLIVLSATVTPLESLDQNSRRMYQKNTRKISCTNGQDCPAYLGSIWDLKGSQVVEKIKSSLKSAKFI